METQNPKHKGVFIAIIILIVVIVAGIVIWRWGGDGLLKILFWFFIILLILFVLGLVFYAVYWLFFKSQKLDLVHVHKQRLIRACKLNKVNYQQHLWFWGGKGGLPSRKVGVIEGVCSIKSQPEQEIKKIGKDILLEDKPKTSKILYCIAFRRGGFLSKLFGSSEVVVLEKGDFSDLSSENIYMYGLSFSPPIYDLFFLSEKFQDYWLTDRTMQMNIHRYNVQETFKELANIVAESIDLSPRHQKVKEVQNLQAIQTDLGQSRQ